MGQIIVQQPNGEEIVVEIAGDSPTDDEQLAIMNQFTPKQSDVNLATASLDEIREYARQQRMMGIDPKTGDKITEEEFIDTYREKDVDYNTGLDSVGGFSRFQFGRMDTDQEKAGYLQTVVGDTGFRQDPLGRFILTKDGRNKLGLGEGKELAVDEEGFTFNDVKEFAGATALPIISGIGASIAASGVGFVPGMLIVGAATAGGKLLDEGIEYAEGLQKQNFSDVARDSAMEGVFGLAGEGIGRGLSTLFGRIIKGPGGVTKGAMETNEALRAQARQIIESGARPTVAGATSESFRPILNRLQSVYEGIFPNEKAAQVNLNLVLRDLQGFGISDNAAIKNLGEIVRKDIKDLYASGDQVLANVQKEFNEQTTKEIEKLIGNIRTGKEIPKDLADMIRIRKRVFDEDVDKLYTKVDNVLKGQAIIPTKGVLSALESLERNTIADIGATKFATKVRQMARQPFTTAKEMSKIRTGLLDATKNPALLNDVNVGALQTLKQSVDDAFEKATLDLADITSSGSLKVPQDPRFAFNTNIDVSLDQATEALGLLSRTNKFYAASVRRFDNITVQNIIKNAQQKRLSLNDVFQNIVLKDEPEAFDQLMKAIRGAPTGVRTLKIDTGDLTGIADLDEGIKTLKSRTIGGRPTAEAIRIAQSLPPESSARKAILRDAQKKERISEEIATIRGTGAEIAEEVRQSLAKKYLDIAMRESLETDPSTGLKIIDPIKLSARIKEKGTTVDKLFRGELDELRQVLNVLDRGKANLAPEVVESLRNLPLGQGLLKLRQTQRALSQRKQDQFTQILQSTNNPDVLAANVFSDVASIKRARRVLNPNTFQSVQDAAMGRILKQIGATVDDRGAVVMTDDFVDAFKSGRLGKKFQNVLRSYGPETLNEMFGRGASDGLNALAEQMIKVSNASITGKGGLAAPQIALALSSIAFIMNPIATATTAAGYAIMSKALRDPRVLKMMMASRKPNSVKEFLSGKFKANDPIAQGFQTMLTLASTATVRSTQMSAQQAEEEARPLLNLQRQKLEPQVNKAITNIQNINIPNINPPANVGSTGGVNPILVPNPVTRATVGSQ